MQKQISEQSSVARKISNFLSKSISFFGGSKDEEEKKEFEDPLANVDVSGKADLIEQLKGASLSRGMRKSSMCGLTGLSNLGNTCFMNSGL